MNMQLKKTATCALSALLLMAMSACHGTPQAAGDNATDIPSDSNNNTGDTNDTTPPPAPAPNSNVVGDSCEGSGKICLALTYVVYENSSGTPVASQQEAIQNVRDINLTWSQCGIAFQMEKYSSINPADYGLSYGPSSMSELTSIRNAFSDNQTLLLATTGSWSISADAWTSMPGGGPYGAVMQATVATYPLIIAHELGHYLGLDHASDSSNVMSPTIYDSSTALSSSQCSAAKATVDSFWPNMKR